MSIVRFNQDSPLQKIKASFLDDTIELTNKQQKIKEQIRFAFSLRLKERYTPAQTIEHLQQEYDCSQATAYRIYQKAMYVFGDIDVTDIKAEKIVLREYYLELYKSAFDDKKYEVAKKILDSYRELFDFNIKEDDIDEGKLKAHHYNIVIDKQVRSIMREQFKTGVVDFNAYPNVEDIEFREVNEEEG
ncbi:hypothetical protein AWE51_00230 [Aquimarina aggregata]|uniref:Uncharacterized protein n=1 Tax=Aquimarina aggregata TaxID=1642818 RepID=A0A162DKS7_9FLAO|nr:hypothetical protein [Aquimarina aggregata]KZS41908.1 hypothetical protein AWE51_00230 [Aquimarina aggregata]